MAARVNKIHHAEKTKRLIRASQLLNRLNDCANGKVELSRTQVAAAKIVIDKEIPDLARHEHVGEEGGPLVVQIVKMADADNSPAR